MKTVTLSRRAVMATGLFVMVGLFNAFSQGYENRVNVGLIYPISSNGIDAKSCSNIFSLNVIGGISREEKSFTAAGFTNVILNDARGFQVAGFSNHIGGHSEGFKAAGFLNTYKNARGFQAAGFANIAKGNTAGMQAAGFINLSKNLKGFQAAGFANLADTAVSTQIAGFINKSADMRGTQIAGFINKANDVRGTQIAGFINVAGNVKGTQLAGFINIADSCDNPIGLINIVGNGERRIGISTDDNFTTMASFRSGGRSTYGIIAIGNNLKNSTDVYAMQIGLGKHIISDEKVRLNAEATITSLENFKKGSFTKYSLSALPAIKLGSAIEIYGGPSLNYVSTNTSDGKTLIKHYIWRNNTINNHLHGMYVGFTAGVHAKF